MNPSHSPDIRSDLSRRTFLGSGLMAGLAGCLGAPGTDPGEEGPVFEEIAGDAGFEYTAQATGVGFGNTGLYVSDYDRDGFPELLAVGGSRPILFDNEGGTLEPSGELDPVLDEVSTVQSALFFDHNRSGWEDLLLLPKHGSPVFLENVDGEFARTEVGLNADLTVPTSAAAADLTGNGDLDVFVAQMGDWADGVPAGWLRDAEDGVLEDDNGAPNLVFLNDGARFQLATDIGITGTRWGLAASAFDLTGNGWPDLHVANDFNRDDLYVNRGDGTFEHRDLPASTNRNGMSSLLFDATGTGRPDLFVTNIFFPLEEADLEEEQRDRLRRQFEFVLQSPRIEGNNLLRNDGDGEFVDIGGDFGVDEGGWGWAAIAADFDLDGAEELLHATQRVFQLREDGHYIYPMYFERTGEGGFENRDAGELGFRRENDRAAVHLDLDRSGVPDVAFGAYESEFHLYRNRIREIEPDRIPFQVWVRDEMGSIALGSTVSIVVNGERQYRFVSSMSDYQSQRTRLLHFGLGESETVDELHVRWPDGSTTTVEDVAGNQRVTITPTGITNRLDL